MNASETLVLSVQPQQSYSVSQDISSNHVQAVASLNSIGVCRICYEDDSKENLISPCNCTGTMGLLHQSCIERWLGSSSSNKCEICSFTFLTERKPKSLREWLTSPTHPVDRKNFIGDSVCFCFLTPLACASSWLCTAGAITYSQYRGYEWETAGLAILAVSLVFIYMVWIMIAMRYHARVISEWRQKNQEVHILSARPAASSHSSLSFTAPSPPEFMSSQNTTSSDTILPLASTNSNNVVSHISTETREAGTKVNHGANLGVSVFSLRQSISDGALNSRYIFQYDSNSEYTFELPQGTSNPSTELLN